MAVFPAARLAALDLDGFLVHGTELFQEVAWIEAIANRILGLKVEESVRRVEQHDATSLRFTTSSDIVIHGDVDRMRVLMKIRTHVAEIFKNGKFDILVKGIYHILEGKNPEGSEPKGNEPRWGNYLPPGCLTAEQLDRSLMEPREHFMGQVVERGLAGPNNGARDFLIMLKSSGVKAGLATSSPWGMASVLLEKSFGRDFIMEYLPPENWKCGDSIPQAEKKPHHRTVVESAKQANEWRYHTVFGEDRISALERAHEAGILGGIWLFDDSSKREGISRLLLDPGPEAPTDGIWGIRSLKQIVA